jgi:hypothetical protein
MTIAGSDSVAKVLLLDALSTLVERRFQSSAQPGTRCEGVHWVQLSASACEVWDVLVRDRLGMGVSPLDHAVSQAVEELFGGLA